VFWFETGFGGGYLMKGNLVFNQVRETGDHGPFNSVSTIHIHHSHPPFTSTIHIRHSPPPFTSAIHLLIHRTPVPDFV
jgi:hypothetical protein